MIVTLKNISRFVVDGKPICMTTLCWNVSLKVILFRLLYIIIGSMLESKRHSKAILQTTPLIQLSTFLLGGSEIMFKTNESQLYLGGSSEELISRSSSFCWVGLKMLFFPTPQYSLKLLISHCARFQHLYNVSSKFFLILTWHHSLPSSGNSSSEVLSTLSVAGCLKCLSPHSGFSKLPGLQEQSGEAIASFISPLDLLNRKFYEKEPENLPKIFF